MSAIDPDLQLHLRRSKCIDAFAAIELEIAAILNRLSPGHDGETLGNKVKRLKAIPACPAFSKKQRTFLHEALAELEAILALRHDIVHGALSVLKAPNITIAAFVNVREATKLGSMARIFTISSLEQLAAEAMRIATKLRTSVAQPAQKPAPKPTALTETPVPDSATATATPAEAAA